MDLEKKPVQEGWQTSFSNHDMLRVMSSLRDQFRVLRLILTINNYNPIHTDAEQYKYGKNRVEADAKRLQSKEEELLKRKEALRNRLAQLRKERKDLRAAIEVNAGMRCFFVLNSTLGRLCILC